MTDDVGFLIWTVILWSVGAFEMAGRLVFAPHIPDAISATLFAAVWFALANWNPERDRKAQP